MHRKITHYPPIYHIYMRGKLMQPHPAAKTKQVLSQMKVFNTKKGSP